MEKSKRNTKRQRAIDARRRAASHNSGSFVANELQHLIGADEETVVREVRWRAKANVYFFVGFYLVVFIFLLNLTNETQGGPLSQHNPYTWACFFAVFIVHLMFLLRYRRLIRNA